jgi:hypothetical protein
LGKHFNTFALAVIRSSQNSTPGNVGSDKSVSSNITGAHVVQALVLDSGSECEEAHIRTAEAFMSGIKSAISASLQVT